MGAISPLGCQLGAIWQRLTAGTSGISLNDRFDTADYGVKIAGQGLEVDVNAFIPPKEQRRIDRYSWYALAAARMAVEDSGIDFAREEPSRSGCVVSAGIGGLETLGEQVNTLWRRTAAHLAFTIPAMIPNISAGLIAIEHQPAGAQLRAGHRLRQRAALDRPRRALHPPRRVRHHGRCMAQEACVAPWLASPPCMRSARAMTPPPPPAAPSTAAATAS